MSEKHPSGAALVLVLAVLVSLGTLGFDRYSSRRAGTEDASNLVIEEDTLEQALARGVPQDIVGRTFRDMIQTCVDPKYLEAIADAAYGASSIKEGNRKADVLLQLLHWMGKCTIAQEQHLFTVIGIRDTGLKRRTKMWGEPRFDTESLGIVEIELCTENPATPSTLYLVAPLPGVNL